MPDAVVAALLWIVYSSHVHYAACASEPATLLLRMSGTLAHCNRQGLGGKLLRVAGALWYADRHCMIPEHIEEPWGWIGAGTDDCGHRTLGCFFLPPAPAPDGSGSGACKGEADTALHWSACPTQAQRATFGEDPQTNDVWPAALSFPEQASLFARAFRLQDWIAVSVAEQADLLAKHAGHDVWVACHVRRGDKTAGDSVPSDRVAGSNTANLHKDVLVFQRHYLPALRHAASATHTSHVLVSTDSTHLAGYCTCILSPLSRLHLCCMQCTALHVVQCERCVPQNGKGPFQTERCALCNQVHSTASHGGKGRQASHFHHRLLDTWALEHRRAREPPSPLFCLFCGWGSGIKRVGRTDEVEEVEYAGPDQGGVEGMRVHARVLGRRLGNQASK